MEKKNLILLSQKKSVKEKIDKHLITRISHYLNGFNKILFLLQSKVSVEEFLVIEILYKRLNYYFVINCFNNSRNILH